MLERIALIFIIVLQYSLIHSQQNSNSLISKLKVIDLVKNDTLALKSLDSILTNAKLTVKEKLEVNYRSIMRNNILQKFTSAIAMGNEGVMLAGKNNLDSLEALFNK